MSRSGTGHGSVDGVFRPTLPIRLALFQVPEHDGPVIEQHPPGRRLQRLRRPTTGVVQTVSALQPTDTSADRRLADAA